MKMMIQALDGKKLNGFFIQIVEMLPLRYQGQIKLVRH